jgi:hypothetical protein
MWATASFVAASANATSPTCWIASYPARAELLDANHRRGPLAAVRGDRRERGHTDNVRLGIGWSQVRERKSPVVTAGRF